MFVVTAVSSAASRTGSVVHTRITKLQQAATVSWALGKVPASDQGWLRCLSPRQLDIHFEADTPRHVHEGIE